MPDSSEPLTFAAQLKSSLEAERRGIAEIKRRRTKEFDERIAVATSASRSKQLGGDDAKAAAAAVRQQKEQAATMELLLEERRVILTEAARDLGALIQGFGDDK